jgi:uracil-DNA glycosylase family 4
MSRRRSAILTEMGLAPIWRLRDRSAEPPAVEAADEFSVEPASAAQPLQPQPRQTIALQPQNPSGEAREQSIQRMDWDALREAVAACTACKLHASRTQTVFGVGDPNADWLLIGEAPGAEEDRQGEPFVGQAGKLLDNMLAALGLKRGENLYIANVLKSRPPGNRNPEPDEVAQCTPFLLRQIALIQPKLIIAMGRFAAQTLLNTEASIASMRGKVHQFSGVPLIVTYHPAYLLRNLPDKAKAWEDLLFAKRTIGKQA